MSGFADEEMIVAVLTAEPLCAQIVDFLLEHDGAMDTTRGVAHCWVNRDEVAVRAALERLVAVGVITSHTLSSGVYYRLTSSPVVRAQLQRYRVGAAQPPQTLRDPSNRNGNGNGASK